MGCVEGEGIEVVNDGEFFFGFDMIEFVVFIWCFLVVGFFVLGFFYDYLVLIIGLVVNLLFEMKRVFLIIGDFFLGGGCLEFVVGRDGW